MASPSLPLLARMLDALREADGPLSDLQLAAQVLGLSGASPAKARQLLEIAAAGDPRLERAPEGWRLVDEPVEGSSRALADAHAVVLAPPREMRAARRDAGEGAPRYTVALGGEREARRAAELGAAGLPPRVVPLGEALRALRSVRAPFDPVAAAEELGVPAPEAAPHDLDAAAALVARLWRHLAEELEAEGVATLGALEDLLDERLEPADFAGKDFGPEDVEALPEAPGVYVFSDRTRRTLYVGQSAQLRARVRSYFAGPPRDEKDRRLRAEAQHLRATPEDTPLDALLREARAIRRLAPLLNAQRETRRAPEEDGLLVLPSRLVAGRRVLFVLRGGGLVARFAVAPGRGRAAGAARSALDLLFAPPAPPGAAAAEGAGIAASWRARTPGVAFLRPGLDGGRDQLLELVTRTLGELAGADALA